MTRARKAAAKPLPILVGLSGKRDLGGREEDVRRALGRAIDAIDEAFPDTPKVLVSGLAEGADMLATEVALQRRSWRAMALLPMPLDDYRGTLGSDAARARFDGLMEHRKVRLRALASLKPGVPRPPGSHGPEYEQLGLWLAENSAILLAVMRGDEKPDRLGGTARVVAARLRGEPDAQAAEVMAHSTEVAEPLPMQPREPEPVLLLDLSDTPGGEPPLRLMLPPGGRRRRTEAVPADVGALRRHLRIAWAIRLYNRRTDQIGWQVWPTSPPPALGELEAFRRGLSPVQGQQQTLWHRSVWCVTLLFLLAVLLLEGFAKFPSTWPFAEALALPRWGAGGYIVVVTAALSIYMLAAWRQWQTVHQDYRAVNEVLRVQHAWWAAGLDTARHHAHRHYLIGAGGSLERVRRAAGMVIAWIRIASAPPQPDESAANRWIHTQADYFERSAEAREERMRAVLWLSWGAFFLAFGLGCWLALYASSGKYALTALAKTLESDPLRAHGMLLVLGACTLAAWFMVGRSSQPRIALMGPVAVLVGFVLLGSTLKALAGDLAPGLEEGPKTLAIVTLVLLLAFAGSVRFAAEKLVWEAEGHAYVEAHRRFVEAERRLKQFDGLPAPEREARRRVLVEALGAAALAENGAWLRAHRERPVEPVLGG